MAMIAIRRQLDMAKSSGKRGGRPKHIPLRTCVACHETKSKRELLRVVRTPDGHVLIDATGKKSGRGAYLCAKLSCWQQAIKTKKLEHEFETTISPEDHAELAAYIATLPADEPQPVGAREQRAGRSTDHSRQ